MSRVYVSLPLTAQAAAPARDVLRGAELALERTSGAAPVEPVVLDGDPVENARRAAADDRALAYIGDFHSRHVMHTAPILGEAGLLQVAPVATFTGLAGPTLVRLAPHDGVGALAIADWLVERGVGELLLVHDHDEEYGAPVGRMCADAARERGVTVRSRPVWNWDEPPEDDLRGAQAVLYVGVAGSGAADLWRTLHAADPSLWLLGSDGVAAHWLARELEPAAAERTRFFVSQRAPFAFYGYEAMALVLDAVATGGGDREATVRAARSTRDRDSVLGRYSLDESGHTTNPAYGRLAVVNGEMVWDVGADTG